MEDFEQFIISHRNPIMKVELFGAKLFFKSYNQETDLFDKCFNKLNEVLSKKRVEKRCVRAQAEWCNEEMIKVTKIVKGLLQNFGFQDKSGVSFHPEETLFLLETNRLELKAHGYSISMQNCYDMVIRKPLCSLNQYRIYKKLLLHGFKVMRHISRVTKNKKPKREKKVNEKRINEENDTSLPSKRLCYHLRDQKVLSEAQQNVIQQLFSNIKQKSSPIFNNTLIKAVPDYYIFMSNNKSSNNCDIHLNTCDTKLVDKTFYAEDKPIIHGTCIGDNIQFYKLININLPFL